MFFFIINENQYKISPELFNIIYVLSTNYVFKILNIRSHLTSLMQFVQFYIHLLITLLFCHSVQLPAVLVYVVGFHIYR